MSLVFKQKKMKYFMSFQSFAIRFKMKKSFAITCIRSDHGKEFENVDFENYCDEHGINHNFSALRTPQQNEVV